MTTKPPHPGYYLDKFLQEMNWEKKDLTVRANLSEGTIHRFCKGLMYPRMDTLESIAKVTGIPVKAFIDWYRQFLTSQIPKIP